MRRAGRRGKALFTLFLACCLALFTIDFLVIRPAHMVWEEWPGFYALFGFVASVLMVLVARYLLRPIVKREEDYYD
ncbi:MAG: hypothetical protein C0613_14810 [Desulfobulbaceae bacterium]|nr:MAG: hypothetical protein C0613_14810 [Desulfobulbaceae bacterium]